MWRQLSSLLSHSLTIHCPIGNGGFCTAKPSMTPSIFTETLRRSPPSARFPRTESRSVPIRHPPVAEATVAPVRKSAAASTSLGCHGKDRP
jgi:hypothetical protein